MSSKSLKLPTLVAFEALPLRKRTLLFRRWVLAQPARKTYDPSSTRNCALCQFAQALGVSNPLADAESFESESGANVSVIQHRVGEEVIFPQDNPYETPSTFGALAKRLTRHLNTR